MTRITTEESTAETILRTARARLANKAGAHHRRLARTDRNIFPARKSIVTALAHERGRKVDYLLDLVKKKAPFQADLTVSSWPAKVKSLSSSFQ